MSSTDPSPAGTSLRPIIHFTAQKGWLNDPNGCLFHEGEWHLFYQHNPYGTEWGHMSWGHAVSRDLAYWDELPVALIPDERGMIFSGSAVVDSNNSAGFQKDKEVAMVAAFTYAGDHGTPKGPYTQSLAYSNDRGRTWTKYAGNPVVNNIAGGSDRDPKIFWHEPTNRWIMVLFLLGGESRRSFALFNSTDLKTWTMTQELPGFFECPELYPLFLPQEKRSLWILQEASSEYLVGEFDGISFKPLQSKRKLDCSPDYYAAQNFNHAPDGRQIQIAWLRGNCFPGAEFNQQMSIPHELRLEKDEHGYVVCRRFALDLLTTKEAAFDRAGAWPEILNDSEKHAVYLNLNGSFREGIEFTVGGTTFTIKRGCLLKNEQSFSLPLEMEISQIEILVDRASVEILLNAGLVGASFSLQVQEYIAPQIKNASGLEHGLMRILS